MKSTLELIHERPPKHTLPRELYLSEAAYRDDLAMIWHREWVFAGHTVELPKPGSWFTFQLGDYPIVVVRGDKGEIRAFHNACRHRGSRICSEAKGRSPKLVCPYHKWTFGLDGNLIYAPSMQADFDKTDQGLHPVHIGIVDTLIYVCVADNPPDFTPFQRDLAEYLAPHQLENTKVAYESNIVERGNWKLVFENNRECYHCEANHPELSLSFLDNPSVSGIAGAEDPALTAFWNSCEGAGVPSRFKVNAAGSYRLLRTLLTDGAKSYTMDKQPAVGRRLDKTGLDDIGVLLYYHYPNTWNHFMGDHAITFRMLPMSPTETLVTTKWLVPKDAVEGKDYDLENLIKVWVATNDQDRRLVEETQRGVSSPAYVPGRYSDISEYGVSQFIDWYCDTMRQRLAN